MGLLSASISLLTFIGVIQCLPFEIHQTGNDGFTINLGSLLVFNHTRESPMMFVGSGDTAITTISGSHKIENYVTKRLPLETSATTCNQELCFVRLSHGDTFVVLKLLSMKGLPIALTMMAHSDDFDRVWLRVAADPGEEVYGGGEQFSYANLRQRDTPNQNVFEMYVNEQGVGRNKSTLITFYADTLQDAGGDYYTTYFPQPTFVSSRKFSFHYDGYNPAYLDFGHEEFHEVNILRCDSGLAGTVYINAEATLTKLVQKQSVLLGRQPDLPDWIQEGVILGVQGGTKTLNEKYNLAKTHQIPARGMWIQDWSGKFVTDFGSRVNWNWKWDSTFYPELPNVIKTMSDDGVRVLGYINPNMMQGGSLYKEASAKGYLVKNSKGDVYLQRSIALVFGSIDMTNPDAYKWYKNVIKTNMIDLGLGGWMADFGEYLPEDAVLHDGRKGVDVHNEWPVLWAKLNREAIEEKGKLGEIVFFTRSGYSGTSNYTILMWNGDQNVDFDLADGLRSTIYATLNMAYSGITLSHFDVGGYTTNKRGGMVRTEELLLRSAEYAVFTPVFRTHEGNEILSNVQWYNASAIDAFAQCAKKFALLANYRKNVVKEAATSGIPAMRPVNLQFEGARSPPDQYMFGSDVLVAPVYEKGVTQRPVTLPPLDGSAKWVYIWNGTENAANQKFGEFPAPLGQPPVFYRSDSGYTADFKKLRNDIFT